jgi:plastocyanin
MKRFTLFIVMLLTGLMLAACGGGDATPPGPAPVTIDVAGYDEFRFDPSTITVEAGAEVTINFQNAGALEHNWLLVSQAVEPASATEADAIAGANTGIIGAGQSIAITFNAPPAGTYTIVCTVPGHAVGGMVGTFISQ